MGSYKLVLYLKLLVVNFIGVPTCEDKILSRPFWMPTGNVCSLTSTFERKNHDVTGIQAIWKVLSFCL
jgi:hypothetical protein